MSICLTDPPQRDEGWRPLKISSPKWVEKAFQVNKIVTCIREGFFCVFSIADWIVQAKLIRIPMCLISRPIDALFLDLAIFFIGLT